MLSDKDFAIIRAALRFLDEEFKPGDDSLFVHYLDDRGVVAGAKVDGIKATRSKLERAKIYLGLKRVGEPTLMSTEIVSTDEDLVYQVDEAVPVSIIDAGR